MVINYNENKDWNKILERDFQRDVCFWLRNNGYKFVRGSKGMKDYWVQDSKGFPDLLIFANGEFKGVELKREKGKASKEQIEIFENANRYIFFRPSEFYKEPNHVGKNFRENHDFRGILKDYLDFIWE